MRCFVLAPLLLVSALISAPAQDAISVDAVSTMRMCSEKNPVSAGPCATPPRALSKANPDYPEKARRSRHEGTVALGVTIGKDGGVHDIRIVKSVDDAIDEAAMKAVSKWKFEPASYQGSPVAVEMTIQVNFRLETNAAPALTPAPTPAPAQAASASEQVRNLYTDANEAYGRHDYQTAANLARRVTTLAPQNNGGWNLLGISLLEMNQLDAAATALQMAIANDPASTFAYNNLGRVYSRQHKYEEAAVQFRKQIVINPQDHYAHANLGAMLRDQKKCGDAMPELEKALVITPNRAEVLLAQGECDIDLGNRAKGLSEMEQATSASSSPNTWNSAAYFLAESNIELDRAEKWSDTSLIMESPRLKDVSLDHLTIEQLSCVFRLAHYWDTRGWIYFIRGDNAKAEAFIEASWWLLPDTAVGNHLGQIYEKTGPRDKAIRAYAMAVAAAERTGQEKADLDDVADAKQRLARLAGQDVNLNNLIARGRTDLEAMSVISLPNETRSSGSADFTIALASVEKSVRIRRVAGEASLQKLAASLQEKQIPLRIPEGTEVEIPLRGTLSCTTEEAQCRLVFLTSEAAVDIARKESASDSSAIAEVPDPGIYNNPAIGIRISLPDEWKLVKEDPGSFSKPHIAMFNKSGTVALFMLTREHLEGTAELYQHMLETGLSQQPEYRHNGTEKVTRDSLTGTRWSLTWNDAGGVAYCSVMEIFTVGDDHYRVAALAPKEIYDRYAEAFENMFRSVQFPMLRTDPRTLEVVK
ncbi:MAG TPA: TonB family protein [Candidatus Acidoferrum sp.]|nr:TonB family protein [Candidatus Acidoferrum sp.]